MLTLVNPTPEGQPPRTICGKFGARRDPMYPCRWWTDHPNGRRHTGIDCAGPYGSPILAPGDGVVAIEGWSNGGGGWRLYIRHPIQQGPTTRNLYSFHMHLAWRALVRVGDVVEAGQVIGYLGSTGSSISPHNHTGLVWDTPYPADGSKSRLYIDPEPIYYGSEDDMKRGDRGERVRTMQERLNEHVKNLRPLIPDGVFGPNTESRVKTWQNLEQLDEDGVLAPLDQHLLMEDPS